MASPKQSPAHCARHPGIETRLSCSACETPICPSCMVMTEVGFKCPGCIGAIKTHAHQVSPGRLLLAAGLAFLGSMLFGWLQPLLFSLPFFVILGLPVAGLVLCWLSGRVLGELIQRLIGYKLGRPVQMCVLAGSVLGLLLGPLGGILLNLLTFAAQVNAVSNLSPTAGILLIQLTSIVLGIGLFMRGLLGAFQVR